MFASYWCVVGLIWVRGVGCAFGNKQKQNAFNPIIYFGLALSILVQG